MTDNLLFQTRAKNIVRPDCPQPPCSVCVTKRQVRRKGKEQQEAGRQSEELASAKPETDGRESSNSGYLKERWRTQILLSPGIVEDTVEKSGLRRTGDIERKSVCVDKCLGSGPPEAKPCACAE